MKQDIRTRRAFLQGAGGLLVWAPFLPSLLRPEEARAQIPQRRRFVSLYSGHGNPFEYFYPASTVQANTGSNTAPLPGEGRFPFQTSAGNVRRAALSGIAALETGGRFSDILSTPGAMGRARIESYFSKMIIARGFDSGTGHGDHWKGHFLSGNMDWAEVNHQNAAQTIDQYMAASAKVYPTAPHFRTLNLHPGTRIFHTDTVSYRKTATGIVPVPSLCTREQVQLAFSKVLLTADNAATRESWLRKEFSLLSATREDVQTLKANRRLSTEDKRKLEAHLQSLDELERVLRIEPQTCVLPLCPPNALSFTPFSGETGWWDGSTGALSSTEAIHSEYNLRIAALALKLNLTKIANICLENDQGTHGNAHERSEIADTATRTLRLQWAATFGREMTRRFAYFLSLLDEEEAATPGRTYLDNTLVLWGSCMSNISNHDTRDLPVILAGAKGWLRTDSFFDYRDATTVFKLGATRQEGDASAPIYQDQRPYLYGRPFNEVLIAAMLWMGLEPSDWEGSGREGFGKYDTWTNPNRDMPLRGKTLASFGSLRAAPPGFRV